MAATEMFTTHNGLSEDVRSQMIGLINRHLADTFDLYSQTKQAHWNVKGPHFYQLHLLFDTLAEQVFPYVDMLAERATALGGVALGTARMAASSSRVEEFPAGGVEGIQGVKDLAQRYAKLANSVRAAIDTSNRANDQGTSDLFQSMVRDLDKALWFLEAHLQQTGAGRVGMPKAA